MAPAPPMAEARVLTKVIPIWTVARNRSGSSLSRFRAAAERARLPLTRSVRVPRVAITAISAAAKKPLARINKKMTVAPNHMLSSMKTISRPECRDAKGH